MKTKNLIICFCAALNFQIFGLDDGDEIALQFVEQNKQLMLKTGVLTSEQFEQFDRNVKLIVQSFEEATNNVNHELIALYQQKFTDHIDTYEAYVNEAKRRAISLSTHALVDDKPAEKE